MKKLTQSVAIALVGLALATVSCKKDTVAPNDSSNNPSTTPNSSGMNAFFNQNGVQAQNFTINNNTYNVITGTKGSKLKIPANSFVTQSNGLVTGNINIEFKEIFSKKDMIMSGAPTTTDGRMLVSGGEMFIKATQGGQNLKLAANSNVRLQAPIQGNPSLIPMNEYYTSILADSTDWNPIDSIGIGTDSVNVIWDSTAVGTGTVSGSGGYYYDMGLDSLNWINFDYLYPNANASIDINVGSQFSYSNCAVFVSVNGSSSVSRAWGYNYMMPHTFSDDYLPAGMPANIVAVAEIGGQYYSAVLPITITNGANYNITLTATTLSQIQSLLSTLP